MNTNTNLNKIATNAASDAPAFPTPEGYEAAPTADRAHKWVAKRKPYLVRKEDGARVCARHSTRLWQMLRECALNGTSRLILTIDFPATRNNLNKVVQAQILADLPKTIVAYGVVEVFEHSGPYPVSPTFTVWENACEELLRLHGTQQRGGEFQIAGYDAHGDIAEDSMLHEGIGRGSR